MNVPTRADWHAWPQGAPRPIDLDEDHARRQFEGKTAEEALDLFRAGPILSVAEDVSYMPPVPFRYYLLVFKRHVLEQAGAQQSSDRCDASDAASSFINLVEHTLQWAPASIEPIMDEILEAVNFVAHNQARYEADVAIYGDFRGKAERIRALRGA